MIKMIKRLFCKHKHLDYVRSDLVRLDDGSWITHHVWKCVDCGKEIY